jgi:hypothetical protein
VAAALKKPALEGNQLALETAVVEPSRELAIPLLLGQALSGRCQAVAVV